MLKNALVIAVLALGGGIAAFSCSSKTDCPAGASHCACNTSAPFCNKGLSCLMDENICIGMGAVNMMGLGGMDTSGGGGKGGSMAGKGGSGGGKGGSGGNTTPEVCTSAPTATECRKCIDKSCCAEYNGCINDSLDCRRLIGCLSMCQSGDDVCQNNCVDASSQAGVDLLLGLFMCLDNKCTSDGMGIDGGTGQPCDPEPEPDGGTKPPPPTGDGGLTCTHPTGASMCRVCLDNSCCAQVRECTNPSSPCAMFGACLNMCAAGDTACENTCAQKNPMGVQPVDNLQQCGDKNCATACM